MIRERAARQPRMASRTAQAAAEAQAQADALLERFNGMYADKEAREEPSGSAPAPSQPSGASASSLLSQLESLRQQLAAKDAQMATLKGKLDTSSPPQKQTRASGSPRATRRSSRGRSPGRAHHQQLSARRPSAGNQKTKRASSPAAVSRKRTGSPPTAAPAARRQQEPGQPAQPRRSTRISSAPKGFGSSSARAASPATRSQSRGSTRSSTPVSARVSQLAVPKQHAVAVPRPQSQARSGRAISAARGGTPRSKSRAGSRGPTRPTQVPRCATPSGRAGSARRSRPDVEEELLVRARWNAELDRTKKLLQEKKRMEKESMFRATKEAQDRVKEEAELARQRELHEKRVTDRTWREHSVRSEEIEKERTRQEAAQRRQELREQKEMKKLAAAEERAQLKLEYQESLARRQEEERQKASEKRRVLQERQQLAMEERQMKQQQKMKEKEEQRRE
eukprot:COSAG02_NODE_13046_length_1453_cov_294.040620_1_plen_451_part_01